MKPLTNDCMYVDSEAAYNNRQAVCEFVNTSMIAIKESYELVYGKMDEDKWIEFQQLLSEAVS
jgi:hypothetical protein